MKNFDWGARWGGFPNENPCALGSVGEILKKNTNNEA